MSQYFYINNEGKQKGTFKPEELQTQGIRRETLVWTQGMPQWARAEEVDELKFLFENTPPIRTTSPETQQQVWAEQERRPKPRNWMTEAILATVLPFLLCANLFSLLGIIAIVNASKVDNLYASGAYDEADEAARQAKLWTKVAMWIGIAGAILFVASIIIMIVVFGSIGALGSVMT